MKAPLLGKNCIMSSYIIHRDRARQLIDFSNLRFGTRMPTDIDGCFEYDDRAMILLEFKTLKLKENDDD